MIKDKIINFTFFRKIMLYKSTKVNSFRPIKKGIANKKRNTELIVSLTSYPLRIDTVHLTIQSLLHQSCKPDKVILWLADSQFENREQDLPENLKILKKYGLSIEWCEDIKSFKKLIPTLKKYPDAIIVTADDDQYYPITWLEGLYQEHKKYKKYIISYDVTKLKMAEKGELVNDIDAVVENHNVSYFNKILGGYGCLYPPNTLHPEVFHKKIFMKYINLNDDIWFWGMAVKNKVKIMRILNEKYKYCMTDPENQWENSLWSRNSVNDTWLVQLNKMIEFYPEIYENLKGEEKDKNK